MRKATLCALAFVLFGGVLVTGGVHIPSYSLMELVIFTVFLLLLLDQTRRGKIELATSPVLGILVLILVFQLVPLPNTIVRWISPQRWEGFRTNGLDHSAPWITLSIYPHATRVAFLKVFTYLASFFLGTYLFDSRKRKGGLVLALVLVGLLEALFGLALYLGGWQDIVPFTREYHAIRARGSFINPNHYAAMLAMTSPFLFGWVYYVSQKRRSYFHGSDSVQPGGQGRSRAGQLPFYTFLLVVMLVALGVSGSRMGIFSALSSLVFMVLLAQLKGRQTRLLVGSFFVLGGVSAYLIWIGMDPIISRFEMLMETGFVESDVRMQVWKDELRLLLDYPWLGTGLGTFGTVFRKYQTTNVQLWFDHAHNDYLQFATELGVIGFLSLFGPIFYLMVRMIRSFLNDPSRYRASVTLGCIGGATALLIHSVTDFNLQIPANAMIFAVILGIGYKASCIERKAEFKGK